MSKNANMPKGFVPHLVVDDAAKALEWYAKAFGAEETCRMPAPDGKRLMHAEMKIGDHTFFLCDDFPEYCEGQSRSAKALGGSSVTIHQYVEDCDAAVARAEKAGAEVKMPPTDMFWGDRYGGVHDPFGHSWTFATHIKDMTPEEMAEGAKAAFGG
ncbi:MAG: VOC family protein [Phycisphaerales bacterium]